MRPWSHEKRGNAMRLGTAALTLTIVLGFVGLASADESGNWFTRLFTPTLERPESPKTIEVKIDSAKLTGATAKNRLNKAKADLERRQEVCLKLIEIADANGDEDLRRKAEMLDQRAYDLYVSSKSQGRTIDRPVSEVETKKGGR